MIQYSKKSVQYFLLFLLALIWGSSFIFMKKGLETFTQYEVAYLRMVSAGIVLVPLGLRYLSKLTIKNAKLFLVSGLLGNGIPAILFTTAQTKIPSSLAGMLNAFVPILTISVGALFFGLKFEKRHLLGISLGFIGVLGLLYFKDTLEFSSDSLYGLLVVLAAICYSFNVNIIKKHLSGYNGVEISSLVFVVMSPIFIILLLNTHFVDKINATSDFMNLGYIVLLGVLGTALATIIFNNILKETTPLFASSVTYLIPMVAVFWGLLDGEKIMKNQYIGMTLILLGVYFINKPLGRKRKPSKEMD